LHESIVISVMSFVEDGRPKALTFG
jgi:hypothetical protein